MTFVESKLDPAILPQDFVPLSELDKKIHADYDPKFYHGAPVALQLVGKRLEEEKVLEMVEVVSQVLKVKK